MKAGTEIGLWKKLFKGWTASFEIWSETARWTAERMMMMPFICSYRNKNEGLQADGAGEQVDIGIGAERLI
jgi:hypothetical protein